MSVYIKIQQQNVPGLTPNAIRLTMDYISKYSLETYVPVQHEITGRFTETAENINKWIKK